MIGFGAPNLFFRPNGILREFITHTIAADHTRPWGLVFRSQLKQRSLPVAVDINCPQATVLHRRPCSVAYIMNIAWSRMLHDRR